MTGKEWEHAIEAMLRAVPGAWPCRYEPKMQAGYRVDGGTPDFGIWVAPTYHLIECKLSSKGWMPLAKTEKGGDGVSPAQAETMDAAERAGIRCWVAARLELSEAQYRKLSQQTITGVGGDVPRAVQQLVPWSVWGDWMRRAEGQRLRGEPVQASIPAADLVRLGYPLRHVGELVVALRSDP